MTTAYTSLLGLALPATGELSGTWGDTVNTAITTLLDTAVAGTTTLTTDIDVTLTTTTGASNQARQAIILWSPASGTVTRNITAPAQSKAYIVINASGGTQSIVLRGAGPTTGVTIVKGETAICAWNGTDFVKVATRNGDGAFTTLSASGTVTFTGLTASQAVFTDASKNLVSNAITGTGNVVMSASPTLTGTITAAAITVSGAVTGNGNWVIGNADTDTITQGAAYVTGTQLKSAKTATNTLNLAAYDVDGAAYTNLVTLTASNTPTLALTSTGTGTINNMSVGATTPSTGAFTTLSSSSDATIHGLTVGWGGGAIDTNTVSGRNAMNSNSTGSYSVAFGYQALLNNVIGDNNTAVGYNALANNTVGGDNTASGSGALLSNQDGVQNVAVGSGALSSSLSSSNNTAVGYQALYNTTTGSNNTSFGALALKSNTVGTFNVAIGTSALTSLIDGSYNVGVGQGAMANSTTGGYNIGVGYFSIANTTGNSNTAIGYSALSQNTTGSNNIAIGYLSGDSIASGSNNVLIGGYRGDTAPISTAGSNWIVLSDGAANVRQAMDATSIQFLTGAVVQYAPAPAATISAVATLTNAQIRPQIVVTSGTTFTLTMPLGTTLETLVSWAGTNLGFDFTVINTASGTITMAVNTGVTSVGTLTVLTGISATFRIRRTAANTFIMYRI